MVQTCSLPEAGLQASSTTPQPLFSLWCYSFVTGLCKEEIAYCEQVAGVKDVSQHMADNVCPQLPGQFFQQLPLMHFCTDSQTRLSNSSTGVSHEAAKFEHDHPTHPSPKSTNLVEQTLACCCNSSPVSLPLICTS